MALGVTATRPVPSDRATIRRPRLAASAPLEDDVGAVVGEDRPQVLVDAGHDGFGDTGDRVGGEDVAAVLVGHDAVGGEAERCRKVTLRARDERETGDEGKDEEGDESHDPPGDRWGGERRGSW